MHDAAGLASPRKEGLQDDYKNHAKSVQGLKGLARSAEDSDDPAGFGSGVEKPRETRI